MLLNLSNHPSIRWSEEQKRSAIDRYSCIEDLPFPAVPPEATTDEVRLLVEEYLGTVRKLDPMAVHVMGEMTFTHQLVTELEAIGIPCVASTSNRNAIEEDGKKIVVFEFVQFRRYQ